MFSLDFYLFILKLIRLLILKQFQFNYYKITNLNTSEIGLISPFSQLIVIFFHANITKQKIKEGEKFKRKLPSDIKGILFLHFHIRRFSFFFLFFFGNS